MSGSGAEAYALFIENSLKAERERRAGQVKSATEVIAVSSALIGLVIVLFALLAGKDYVFVSSGRWFIVLSLLLFFLSAAAALIAGQLVQYLVAQKATLSAMLTDHWGDSADEAMLATAWINFDTLTSLHEGCNKRSRWLDWALRLQVAGAIALAVGMAWQIVALP